MSRNRVLIKKYKDVNVGEVSLPVCFNRAEGSYIYDCEDNRYLDFTSGYGVTNTGWLRSEITDAIQKQLKRAAYAPPWLPSCEAIALSNLLLEIVPGNLVKCARAIGGADANEIIHKAVYSVTGKKGIISFYRSYHGGTHFTLNISDTETFHLPQMPTGAEFHFVEPPYCYRCPHGKTPDSCNLECTAAIEQLMKTEKDIGSFIAEPVLGSGGVIVPPPKYWKRIRELCTHYNVFLVFDEVLTGFGRLGAMTASDLFDTRPDAISFAKAMSGGYAAMGACVMNNVLAEGIKKYEDVSATYAWTPLACVAAKANIELIIRENLALNSFINGKNLLHQLRSVFSKYLPGNTGEIRGAGLMIGIELVEDLKTKAPDKKLMRKFIIMALRNGLMVCASWDFQAIVLMPPLSINEQEINEGMGIIEMTLKQITMRDCYARESNSCEITN